MNPYLADICRALYVKGYSVHDIVGTIGYLYDIDLPFRSVRSVLALDTYADRPLPLGWEDASQGKRPSAPILLPFTENIITILDELYTYTTSKQQKNDLIDREVFSLSLSDACCEAPNIESRLDTEGHGGHRDWIGQEFDIWYEKDGRSGLQNYLLWEKRDNKESEVLPRW